eukprot:2197210-Prymnesium_polylepis.1
MQPSHPTRHLKRVCYAENGGPRVSLPVGVGPGVLGDRPARRRSLRGRPRRPAGRRSLRGRPRRPA